jgi:hypothetical protein
MTARNYPIIYVLPAPNLRNEKQIKRPTFPSSLKPNEWMKNCDIE